MTIELIFFFFLAPFSPHFNFYGMKRKRFKIIDKKSKTQISAYKKKSKKGRDGIAEKIYLD